jgi:outer membrane protein assembly factor BamB
MCSVLLVTAWAVRAAAESPAGLALHETLAAQNGLCLYLGADRSQPLLQLAAGSRLHVQGVVADRERAERLRQACQADANAGRLSVLWRRTAHLPYLDDLVDLVVAEGWGTGDLKGLALAEVVRVLRPGGVAVVGNDAGADAAAWLAEAGGIRLAKAEALARPGAWIRIVKQMDPRYGDWPDTAGRPEQTGVSPDTVAGPGREIRWINQPTWSSYTSFNDIVAGGRDFHHEKAWINPNLSHMMLVARNAHNGCELWRVKIGETTAADWRGSNRIVCADEQRVFCNEGGRLISRNASTGKQDMEYGPAQARVTSMGRWLISATGVIDKETGKLILPLSCAPYRGPPAAGDGVVYVLHGDRALGDCVEARQLPDGKSLWKVPFPDFAALKEKAETRLMCRGDNVYLSLGGRVVALERSSGKVRWSYLPDRSMDLCMMMALPEHVSLKYKVGAGKTGVLEQVLLDAKNGQEIRTSRASAWIGARCFPTCSTDRYLLANDGMFVDHVTGVSTNTVGVRPTCNAGSVAAYGLIYNGPHYCSCLISLRGALAYSPGSALPPGAVAPQLLTTGVAPAGAPARAGDWPMVRHDGTRSDCYAGELPVQLKPCWSVKLGSTPIPQATAAGKVVFVADPEQHRVVALNLDSGSERWAFATEGRVSMAPTYYNGLCLFGDHAGQVYALEAATGKRVWQMQAAPEQKMMSSFNRFESAWPVLSGVLVLRDRACFVAGRGGTMDGGLTFYDVAPLTGNVLRRMNFNDARPADLLVSDGREVILPVSREAQDAHLPMGYNPDGNTNAPVLPRLRAGGIWYQMAILSAIDSLEPGQSANRKRTLGVGNFSGDLIAFDGTNRVVTSARNRRKIEPTAEAGQGLVLGWGATRWTNKETRQQMQALLLAGARVYAAGIPDCYDRQEPPMLWVLAADDGRVLQKLALAGAPSIDGLSAAGGRLLVTTLDGQVQCFGAP